MNDTRDIDRTTDTAGDRATDGDVDFIEALVGAARAEARAAEAERRADERSVASNQAITTPRENGRNQRD